MLSLVYNHAYHVTIGVHGCMAWASICATVKGIPQHSLYQLTGYSQGKHTIIIIIYTAS